jgi:hypothetical protein
VDSTESTIKSDVDRRCHVIYRWLVKASHPRPTPASPIVESRASIARWHCFRQRWLVAYTVKYQSSTLCPSTSEAGRRPEASPPAAESSSRAGLTAIQNLEEMLGRRLSELYAVTEFSVFEVVSAYCACCDLSHSHIRHSCSLPRAAELSESS